ncbi:MAG TPA: ATP-binding cassette domain-containing protein, partial [Cytophagales bacterium]|nr:ATP-binding cassette domain-containing protein [Cytophagales bacterium]
PQVYTNEVTVFDQQRGTGESVWDIKRRIGVVSPELHIYFMRENKQAYRAGTVAFDPSSLSLTVYQVVASGFDDHQGMATALTYSHRQLTSHWMTFLALQDYKDERFHLVSLGVQRLALLARALVKNPPLLVLDEPTQGLDAEQIRRFNALIDQICLAFSKTLIYVSHHQEHLPKCIERTLLLQEGGIWTIIDNNRQDRTSLVHLK